MNAPILTMLIAGLLMAMPVPALAQADAAACATIADDAERLACYDDLFRAPAPPADGADSVVLTSSQLIPARPSGRQPAQIVVACEAGVLSIRFSFAGQMLSATGDFAPITLQIDAQTARTRTLGASEDNTALILSDRREVAAFLDSLVAANTLAVRVTPTNSRSLSVRFPLSGVADRVAPIRQACE